MRTITQTGTSEKNAPPENSRGRGFGCSTLIITNQSRNVKPLFVKFCKVFQKSLKGGFGCV